MASGVMPLVRTGASMFGERRRGWHAWLWWFVTALLSRAVGRYSHVDVAHYGAFWKAHW